MLRPIANLCNLNKIMEKIVSEMVISDMSDKLDPTQYGNQKHNQHPALPGQAAAQDTDQCGECCLVYVC